MEFRTATGERICHCRISGLPLFVGLAESMILAKQQEDNKHDYETGVGIFRTTSGKRAYRISGPAELSEFVVSSPENIDNSTVMDNTKELNVAFPSVRKRGKYRGKEGKIQ